MASAALRLDEVAQRLGVSTDAGIVDRLDPIARRLDAVVHVLTAVQSELGGAVPYADAAVSIAVGHIEDAVTYVASTARAAEEHRRGEW